MAGAAPVQQRTDYPDRFRFTADQYQAMGASGVFHLSSGVELIDGEVLALSPMGARRVLSVGLASETLMEQARRRYSVFTQSAVRLESMSEPQPDVLVVRRDYGSAHIPYAQDVLLVIDVADSSRAYDRNVKSPLYAAAGIPEAWHFDLVHTRIETHTDPMDGQYRTVQTAGSGGSLALLSIPGLTIVVDEVLGLPGRSQ